MPEKTPEQVESPLAKYPDLRPLLEQPITYLDLVRLYIKLLRRENDPQMTMAANKLEQAAELADNHEILNQLEAYYMELKTFLDNWCERVNFPYDYSIFKRRKNFIGTLEKIFQCLEKGKLSEVNDILGFRIMINNGKEDTKESVHWLYLLTEQVYEFFTKKKMCCPFTFQHVPTENWYTGKKESIYIPDESEIPASLLKCNTIKDYVAFPKENGYQSIHIVFTGNCGGTLFFEIQFRTQTMHAHAEAGEAEHEQYKEKRYNRSSVEQSFRIPIETYPNIRIIGYIRNDPGSPPFVNDPIGLNTSVDPFNSRHRARVVYDDEEFLNKLYGPPPKKESPPTIFY